MYKDPRQKNEHAAWLSISGFDFSPTVITEELSIKPTDIKIKGEFRIVGKKSPQKVLNKDNYWILDSEMLRSTPIEDQIEYILNKIRPQKQKFINISSKYKISLNCATYYYEANPGISLENNMLKEIAELNLPLYFDIYCLAGTIKMLDDVEVREDLIKQLSQVKFISSQSDKKNDEPRNLVESLKWIESSTDKIKNMYLPDLFVEGEMPDKYYKDILDKIANELKVLSNYINKSRYLQKQTDDKQGIVGNNR